MRFQSLALAALVSLQFLVSALPHEMLLHERDATACDCATASLTSPVTTWLPCVDCTPTTVTDPNQLVTSVHKSVKTTSFYADSAGVHTPPYQTNVWTVHEPTWVTYEVPCATAYVLPYSDAVCTDCIKHVYVVFYVDIEIIFSEYETWTPVENSYSVSTVNPTATSSFEYTPTYATVPYGPAKTHTVKVGGLDNSSMPILRYDPEYIDGRVGDIVEFIFLANNHTATQADFDSPCSPKMGGFNSGFRPNKQNILGQVSSTFIITVDTPTWFYCAQTVPKPHCQAGMVFAVNPAKSGNKTLDNFQKAAMQVAVVSSTTVSSSTAVSRPTTTASYAPCVTHMVTVGGLVAGNPKPVLRYNPETVIANVGDVVEFNFLTANHTATQSSFDSPCVAIPDGFKTGVQMNPNNIDRLIIKQFLVTDTNPVWFYCGFATHCQQGMVFAINPLGKFDVFQAKALASPPRASTTSGMTSATAV